MLVFTKLRNVLFINIRLCISLLLVTVGIICNGMGSKSELIINILFDGENISFNECVKYPRG